MLVTLNYNRSIRNSRHENQTRQQNQNKNNLVKQVKTITGEQNNAN
jgi:hypothetical protein